MNHPIKPFIHFRRPEEFFTQRVELSEIQLGDGENVDISNFNPSNKFYFDRRSVLHEDYDEYYLVEYKEEKTPNPNYVKELAKYEKEKANFDLQLKEYESQLRAFKEWSSAKKVEERKKLFQELKAEFEPQTDNLPILP